MSNHRAVLQELKAQINPTKAAFYPDFFKAFPGGYGEGDHFLGVVVPDQRKIAKRHRHLPIAHVEKLLDSKWHECRLTGLFILVHQFDMAETDADQTAIANYYLSKLDRVNNWDLVDATAHKILGEYLLPRPHKRNLLLQLAKQDHLWSQRISVIATLPLIKAGEFDEILNLSENFMGHPHDLMHKAVGWMLREVGKVDVEVLRSALSQFAAIMPRTMLRYAIEKLDRQERNQWLGKS